MVQNLIAIKKLRLSEVRNSSYFINEFQNHIQFIDMIFDYFRQDLSSDQTIWMILSERHELPHPAGTSVISS